MNIVAIQRIQQRILELLSKGSHSLVGVLLQDSCSEVARIVADWIGETEPPHHLLILKGTNVCGTIRSHDIVAIIDLGGGVYIIDPTIWHFFPKAESILVTVSNNLGIALEKIGAIYGGKWSISEEVCPLTNEVKKKYLEVISQNIQENLRESS